MYRPQTELDGICELLASVGFDGVESRHVVARARSRALAALDPDAPDSRCAAMAILIAEVLTALWLERQWRRDALDDLLEKAAEVGDVSPAALRTSVAVLVLRDARLLELPSALAVETQLRRVLVFAPIESASVWALADDGGVEPMFEAGGGDDHDAAADAARTVLDCAPRGPDTQERMVAAPILRWQRPHAALVALAAPGGERAARFLLEEAASVLAPALERHAILRRNTGREQALTEASERSLERLGLDLHDGPIQDFAALAADLRLYESQLRSELRSHDHAQILIGRVGDLQARLRALHGDLRDLSENLAAPRMLGRSLARLLEAEADWFRERTDIRLELELHGDLDVVSPAQRVALLRVTQEALNNIRDHAGATHAAISVDVQPSDVVLTVSDDGRGFEVQHTVADAARRGRLGLVGMSERMRLLGGSCSVVSRPGGPTRIVAELPVCDAAGKPAASAPPAVVGPTP